MKGSRWLKRTVRPNKRDRPQATPKRSRIIHRHSKGSASILRRGIQGFFWSDLYHALLTLSWSWFLMVMGLSYLAINAAFALAYLAIGDGIENARPGSFADAFFFSVQTMASIGYGAMYPKTLYAHCLVTLESIVGLLGIAIATGLMFARFSRPTARVLFSNVAVVASYNGVPTLMFRAGNQRQNQILEAQLWVTLVRNEITTEGAFMRRFYDLQLVRSQSPVFALSWTAMHLIDQSSPLYGTTPDSLQSDEAEIVVILTGLDETFSQTIHARHSFVADEILWNSRFVDILSRSPDGRRIVDYKQFHAVVPEHP